MFTPLHEFDIDRVVNDSSPDIISSRDESTDSEDIEFESFDEDE